jgi:hypothetical protein
MADINYWLGRKYANLETGTVAQAQESAARAGLLGAQALGQNISSADVLAGARLDPLAETFYENVQRLSPGVTPSRAAPDFATPISALRESQRVASLPSSELSAARPRQAIPTSTVSITPRTTSETIRNIGQEPTASSRINQEILDESRRQGTGRRFGGPVGVPGYKFGGAVELNPLYENYRTAMARAGMQSQAVDPETFLRGMAQMESQRRMTMANQTNMGGTMGYAQGGAVDVGGMQVLGPGDGKSDSIPAIVDGKQPAALSTGEFIFPKKVAEYYGTKFLDAMVAKARQALREKQYA